MNHSEIDCAHWREVKVKRGYALYNKNKEYRHYKKGDLPFTNAIKLFTIQQIKHAKDCWNSARYAESMHNTLCALNKLHRPVLSSMESKFSQQYPVLSERYTIYNTSEALELDTEEFYEDTDHWVT